MSDLKGCGDHACDINPSFGGMGTNGGCRCSERMLRRAVRQQRAEIARLRAEVASLKGDRDFLHMRRGILVIERDRLRAEVERFKEMAKLLGDRSCTMSRLDSRFVQSVILRASLDGAGG